MKKKIFAIVLLSCFLKGFSQVENFPIEPTNLEKREPLNKLFISPDVYSFNKVNFLPINLYTGKAEINVPLYTIKYGDITIPIEIRYDIGANKVDNIASNVGWGWSLQAGGAVSKMVRDIDDQTYDISGEIAQCTEYGYCDDNDLQNHGFKLLRLGYLRRIPDQPMNNRKGMSSYLSNFNEDALPDLFMASAPGLSARFHLERDFSDYNFSQKYKAKVLDGKQVRVGDVKYDIFNTDAVKNYAGFLADDVAPYFYVSPNNNGVHHNNPLYQIRGYDNVRGLINVSNQDYESFSLTNELGTKYKFATYDINESTSSFSGTSNPYYGMGSYGRPNWAHFGTSYKINKNTWYLDKIEAADNKSVSFSYTPIYSFNYDKIESYTGLSVANINEANAITNSLEPGMHFNDIASTGAFSMSGGNNPTSMVTSRNVSDTPLNKSGTFTKTTQQQYLNIISWNEGEVLFQYDLARNDRPDQKALTKVIVKSKSGKVIKQYHFLYSYFVSTETGCTNTPGDSNCFRLKLEAINELDNASHVLSSYNFEYETTGTIPKLHSHNKDFLGYYNAAGNSVVTGEFGIWSESYLRPKFTFTPNKGRFSILPFQISSLSGTPYLKIDGEANINANQHSLNGLLKKIKYPMGGTTELIYENNSFNHEGVDIISGGARIKSQILNDGKGHIVTKKYEYVTPDGKSSGVILNFPKIADFLSWNSSNKNLTFQSYNHSKANIELTQDSYVGYSRIIEKEEGNGRTEYLYNSAKEYPNEYESPYNNIFTKNSFFPGRSFVNNDNRRGTLAHKYIYNNNNVKLLEENYEYNNYKILDAPIRSFSVATNTKSMGWFLNKKENYTIKLLNSINRPSSQEVIEYQNGKAIKTKTEHLYNSSRHLNLTEQKISYPDGNSMSTNTLYVQDNPNPNIFESVMAFKNMVSVPMGKKVFKNNIKVSEEKTVYAPADAMPEELTTRYLPKHFYSNFGYADLDLAATSKDKKYTINVYDDMSNIVQYTMENNIPVTLIWGYNKTKIIAKIEGAELFNIPQGLIENIVTASNQDAQLDTDGSEQALINALDIFRSNTALLSYQTTTYSHDLLIGVKSVTPPSGVRERYIYDSAGRLKHVLDAHDKVLKEVKYNYKN